MVIGVVLEHALLESSMRIWDDISALRPTGGITRVLPVPVGRVTPVEVLTELPVAVTQILLGGTPSESLVKDTGIFVVTEIPAASVTVRSVS